MRYTLCFETIPLFGIKRALLERFKCIKRLQGETIRVCEHQYGKSTCYETPPKSQQVLALIKNQGPVVCCPSSLNGRYVKNTKYICCCVYTIFFSNCKIKFWLFNEYRPSVVQTLAWYSGVIHRLSYTSYEQLASGFAIPSIAVQNYKNLILYLLKLSFAVFQKCATHFVKRFILQLLVYSDYPAQMRI